MEGKSREQVTLFQSIPWIEDTQAAFALLLMCGSTRTTCWLRKVQPDQTEDFARRHDEEVWRCLRTVLGTPSALDEAQVIATLALSAGGLGLTSAQRVKGAAHFASWADCLRKGRERHLLIAELMIRHLEEGTAPCFQAVRQCKDSVTAAGLVVPSWTELSLTPPEDLEDPEPNQPRHGWQQKVTRQLEEGFSNHVVWPRLNDSRRALSRSQHGPLASAALIPTSRATRIDPQPFRLLLCRRLHLPLPRSHRTCRCGRQLDVFGHHRAACSEVGVSGKRGFPLECAAAQVCMEAGAWVATNVFVRDMDLATFNAEA